MAKLSAFIKQVTGTENLIALHNSRAGKDGEGNVHVHIIVAERIKLPEPEVRIAERALFYDEQGVRRYKKSKIMNDNGELRCGCRIVPKGTVLYTQYFSEKLLAMKKKSWLQDMKYYLADWINEELQPDEKRTVYDPRGPYLAQRHIGKGCSADTEKRLKRWNGLVKRYNELVRKGYIPLKEATHYKTRIALSPDRMEELEAVLGELFVKRLPDSQYNAPFEKNMDKVSRTPRTKDTNMEDEKRRLRELYKSSTVAWKRYRNAGNLDEKMQALAEAKEVSAAIESIRQELGYDGTSSYNRRQAIYEIDRERGRQAAAHRRSVQSEAYKERAQAYEFMKSARDYRDCLKGKWKYNEGLDEWEFVAGMLKKGDPRIDEAEQAFRAAREVYKVTKKATTVCRKANKLVDAYKKFALELAGDDTVPDTDVERARDRYLRALRQLEDPTSTKVRELSKQLKDLQESQALRDEKRKALNSEEKNRRKNDSQER